jgi:FAD:protein FMN transferase
MSELKAFKFFLRAMGSACDILIFHKNKDVAQKAAEIFELEIRRIELKYSRYKPDSFLSKINGIGKQGGSVSVDDETAMLIDHAFKAYTISDGLFDVTSGIFRRIWHKDITQLPSDKEISKIKALVGLEKLKWKRPLLTFPVAGMELDFGGVCKEYAADRAANYCKEVGIENGYVNLGGDFSIIGCNPDGSPIRLGVINPNGVENIAVLGISKGGKANSGIYGEKRIIDGKKMTHIINPKTGWPIHGLPAVTVVADTCLEAGMLSTIGLLMDEKAEEWLQKYSKN